MKFDFVPLRFDSEYSDDIILSDAQLSIINGIHERNSRFNIIRSPANVGKTLFSCVLFAICAVQFSQVGETNFIVTYDSRSFVNNIAPVLTKVFKQLGEDVKLHDRTTTVRLSNGSNVSYISSCSASPEAKTRGTNISFVFIDELSKISDTLVYAIISRVRNNPYRKIIATTNADSMVSGIEPNWVYEKFFRNDNYLNFSKKNLNVVRLTHDDAFVDKDKMDEYHDFMRTFLPANLISNFIDDEFAKPSDLVYHEVLESRNRCEVETYVQREDDKYYASVDVGFGHRCGIVLFRHTGNVLDPVVVVDCVAEHKMVSIDISNVLSRWSKIYKFSLKDIDVCVDPSAAIVREELSNYGLRTINAENSVDDGVMLCNILAKRGLLKILYLPCLELITEMAGFNFAKKNKKVDDDACDAFRYGIATFFDNVGRNFNNLEGNKRFEALFS